MLGTFPCTTFCHQSPPAGAEKLFSSLLLQQRNFISIQFACDPFRMMMCQRGVPRGIRSLMMPAGASVAPSHASCRRASVERSGLHLLAFCTVTEACVCTK